MSYRSRRKENRMTAALAIAAASIYVLKKTEAPIINGAEINEIAAVAACLLALSGFSLAADLFRTAGEFADWLDAKRPKGIKGSAGWVKSLRKIKKDLVKRGWGPYWGTFKGREIIADYASNALTLGPSGSGKGVGVVLPTMLAIRESKIATDFKGEASCVLKSSLEARGETFRCLNLGGLWKDELGESDRYNPLDIICDNFERYGGLCDITGDLSEFGAQLSPAPVSRSGGGDNKYFLEGERDLIGYAICQSVLVYGRSATLGNVLQLLNNVQDLYSEAHWVCGRTIHPGKGEPAVQMPIEELAWTRLHDAEDVANFATHHRGWAAALIGLMDATDSRSFQSFLTGARQALGDFNITTRAHKVLQRSTFRFSDCKEGDNATTASIVVDASRMEAQKKVAGLVQWCATTEIKRHKNKQRPVYFIADEATNFKIHDLPSLLTWGRGYGLRLHLIMQSLSAFRSVYGKFALETLLSETEIKQFLSGQREPETLAMIEKLLGEQAIIAKSISGRKEMDSISLNGFSYQETGRPQMTADEIRRTDKDILIIRKNMPVLTESPPIAAIAPWRKQTAINPFHGKPFLLPVRLRLHHRDGGILRRVLVHFRNLIRRRA